MAAPFFYKKMARIRFIVGIILTAVTLSVSVSLIAQLTGMVSTRYTAPPEFTGCVTLYRESFSLFYGLIFGLSLAVDGILVMTYCVLSKYLNNGISTSSEIKTLRRGALLVTALTSGSFFVAYLPILVVFLIFTADRELLTELKAPYLMCLDYVVRLLFHLNSCVVPLFLVSSRTLKTMKTAASVSKNRLSIYQANAHARSPTTAILARSAMRIVEMKELDEMLRENLRSLEND